MVVVYIIADNFGVESQSLAFSRLGNVYAIDYILSSLRKSLDATSNYYVFSSEQDTKVRSEWTNSRGPCIEVIYHHQETKLHHILSQIILDIHDSSSEEAVIIYAPLLVEPDFSFGTLFKTKADAAYLFITESDDTLGNSKIDISSEPIEMSGLLSCVYLKPSSFLIVRDYLSLVDKNISQLDFWRSIYDKLTIEVFNGTSVLVSSPSLELKTVDYWNAFCSSLPTSVDTTCPARVGLLGNPSDGFNGQTISFLLGNFSASVSISPSACVEIVPNPAFDCYRFSGLDDLRTSSETKCYHVINDPLFQYSKRQCHILQGYYGGLRLIQATCKVFTQLCFQAGILVHVTRNGGFSIRYDTTIPRMVGLSGSSAIVVATFEALMTYFGVRCEHLKVSKSVLPNIILDIERIELGISAGLQDRVIQTYGGLMFMDFRALGNEGCFTGEYTRLDVDLLPCMYVCFDMRAGSESGKVHSTVKQRWNARDPELIAHMNSLGDLAARGRECLSHRDFVSFAKLMESNFILRRKIYGDSVVGQRNISAIELAQSFSLSSKFTGSGGALICTRSDGLGWLDLEVEAQATADFLHLGYKFERVIVSSKLPFVF